jgi:hypothetical protein
VINTGSHNSLGLNKINFLSCFRQITLQKQNNTNAAKAEVEMKFPDGFETIYLHLLNYCPLIIVIAKTTNNGQKHFRYRSKIIIQIL